MMSEQRMSPFSQFFLLIGLCGAGIVLGTIALVLLAKWMLGISAFALQDAMNDANNVEFLRWAQTIGAFCMLALPIFFFAFIMDRKPFQYLGFSSVISTKQIGIIILLTAAGLLASDFLSIVNQHIPISQNAATYFKQKEDEYSQQVMILARMKSPFEYILSLVILAFLPAMFEEMFFRGGLQPIVTDWTKNAFAGILITSILFSAIHLSYYGFLPRLFLGMILGYIFYYGKNIWLNILMHFLNNAVAITQMYILSRSGKLNANTINESEDFAWYIGLAGLIVVIALLKVFKAESNNVLLKKVIPDDNYNIQ